MGELGFTGKMKDVFISFSQSEVPTIKKTHTNQPTNPPPHTHTHMQDIPPTPTTTNQAPNKQTKTKQQPNLDVLKHFLLHWNILLTF